jgi:choline dehydrogenase-like flavoprotein
MKYDLIVVGTSFSSTFFLKRYLNKVNSEAKILVLERGGRYDHALRMKVKRNEMKQPEEFRFRDRDTYLSESDKPWAIEPNFGGCSNCWVGCAPRFMPNDFKMKSTYGVGVDWPLSYADLESYYYEVEDIMAISGPDATPFPKSKPYPLPPNALGAVDKVLQQHYGPLFISQPSARPSQSVNGRPRCCTSSVCVLCPIDSKFTIENSMKSVFDDPRITLKEFTQVVSMRIENSVAKSVIARSNNQEIEYEGELIALGTNAIFNAHILLNSGDDSYWTGRGISDQVGTFVRFYLDGLDNVGGGTIITANGYMFYDGAERSKQAGCLIESIGSPYIRNERGKWRQIALFKFIYEDLPSENNYVALSDDPTKPKVVFKGHSEYTDRGLAAMKENINKYFSVLPIESIEYDGYNQQTEFHICGTTRMSDNPNEGVIDKNMVHHKYRNVLVLGSGAFPTITPANPTVTLSALSLMAADKLF